MPRFTLGTFNLYNLILPGETLYESPGDDDVIFAEKGAWIRSLLDEMQADIVGFQEVFHGQALRQALDGSFANVVVREDKLETLATPNVALATSFPVIEQKYHEEVPVNARLDFAEVNLGISHFSRPVLEVKLDVFGVDTCVFVAHLKSKRGVFPDDANFYDPLERAKAEARSLILRAQDAAGLRALIVASVREHSLPVIAMGDFNDDETSVTTRMVSGNPPFSRPPNMKHRKLGEALLYDVQELQRRHRLAPCYSHIHDGRFETLDHILVSEEFLSTAKNSLGEVEWVRVLNDHLLGNAQVIEPGTPRHQSDHGPVVASIFLPEQNDDKDESKETSP
ncbi:MAG: endonuclease/exonuclease/phosphatase family protein [Deltaproteobacteria bacterium]|nr:endonuclease/exonuclease/phosphatase family protein [Deltaproteobacteria bacterium]